MGYKVMEEVYEIDRAKMGDEDYISALEEIIAFQGDQTQEIFEDLCFAIDTMGAIRESHEEMKGMGALPEDLQEAAYKVICMALDFLEDKNGAEYLH
jgi:hypothetical protein